MEMDEYVYMRTIREAIYGNVMLYRARESREEEVAIKMMSAKLMEQKRAACGAGVKEDGYKELAILKLLDPHANVLNLICDFRTQDKESVCLVFEYCPYGELFDYMQGYQDERERKMDDVQIANWFRQIVHGVMHIHEYGVAHRDLSLENILLDKDYTCRICDFGLATENGELCSGKVGKPFYMAPEVYTGGQKPYEGT